MITRSVNLIPEAPIATMVALAVHAETLGFDRCWVYDEGLATRDVHVTMSAIAMATERLAVGPGITNPYTRHPAQTAAAIASLDEISGGRAFLGIGAGGTLTLDPLGLSRTTPLAAVREMIQVCRALFAGGPTSFRGRHVELRSAALSYGRPDIEIWPAGHGPKMLQLGGAVADGVMLDFIHRPSLADYVSLAAAEHVRDEWVLPFVISGSIEECAATLAGLVDQHGFVEFLIPVFDRPDAAGDLRRVASVLDRI